MRKMIVAFTLGISTAGVLAQQGVVSEQRSSNPRGIQIQDNSQINIRAQTASSVAAGEGNAARNSAPAISGDTQIQGNTKINAQTKNLNAVSVGQGNAANNKVGTIGDN